MPIADDLKRIALQENELRLPRLNAQFAWELGSCLHALAKERKHDVVIDVRRFGQQLFYVALDNTTPDNPEWVRRKSNSVARFLRSSYAVGLELRATNTTLFEIQGLSVAEYAVHGGSFPLNVEGVGVIGSVTVSGLADRADHELVVEALCSLLNRDYAALKLGPQSN
jgi:uncharacterized protein (UPF0303 family)